MSEGNSYSDIIELGRSDPWRGRTVHGHGLHAAYERPLPLDSWILLDFPFGIRQYPPTLLVHDVVTANDMCRTKFHPMPMNSLTVGPDVADGYYRMKIDRMMLV